MKLTTQCTLGHKAEETYTVIGVYYPGSVGNYPDPDEPAEVTIEAIFQGGKEVSIDITPDLSVADFIGTLESAAYVALWAAFEDANEPREEYEY